MSVLFNYLLHILSLLNFPRKANQFLRCNRFLQMRCYHSGGHPAAQFPLISILLSLGFSHSVQPKPKVVGRAVGEILFTHKHLAKAYLLKAVKGQGLSFAACYFPSTGATSSAGLKNSSTAFVNPMIAGSSSANELTSSPKATAETKGHFSPCFL